MTRVNDRIETDAAEWLIRVDSAGSPKSWAELDAWLAADPRQRAAFLRLAVAWRRVEQLQRLRALDGSVHEDLLSRRAVRSGSAAARERGWSATRSFGFRAPATAVAILAALAVVAQFAAGHFNAQIHTTRVGGHEHFRLADGSTVDLNTDSELRVRFTADSRELTLLQGEAAFKVAHDPGRPFDVRAGSTTFRAVGTAFSVRLHSATGAVVHVTEGRVAIDPPFTTVVVPGEIAKVERGHVRVEEVPLEILTSKLAWTQGRLYFNGETLADAVAEFNRYNRRPLVIVAPKIAAVQISGTFEATDPETFVTALEDPFGIRALPSAPGGASAVIRLDGKDP